MRPDLVIREREVPRLLVDCKYKRLEPDEIRHHDLYQVLAYYTAMNVEQGLLVYSTHEANVRDEIRVRHALVRIQQTTIDLSGDGAALRAACDHFAYEAFV